MLTRMPYLERDGDVFVLHLGDRDAEVSENRFHPDRLAAIHSLLDEVEAHDGPAALVTAATGKFWSNGLDIDWVGANLPDLPGYLDSVHALYVRLLTFPAATVAAASAIANGLTTTLPCPKPSSARCTVFSAGGTDPENTGRPTTPYSGPIPNAAAAFVSASAGISDASFANEVLHERANAVAIETVPSSNSL